MGAAGWIVLLLGCAAAIVGVVLDATVAGGGWQPGRIDLAASGHLIAGLGGTAALGGIALVSAAAVTRAIRRAADRLAATGERPAGRSDLGIPAVADLAALTLVVPPDDPIVHGSRVVHARHGAGTVARVEARSAAVQFDRGGTRVVPLDALERAAPVA